MQNRIVVFILEYGSAVRKFFKKSKNFFLSYVTNTIFCNYIL